MQSSVFGPLHKGSHEPRQQLPNRRDILPQHQQAVTVYAVDLHHRRRCRPDDLYPQRVVGRLLRRIPDPLPQQLDSPTYRRLLRSRHRNGELIRKGRVLPQAAQRDLGVVKPLIVLGGRRLYHIILRCVGLYHSPPGLVASARTANHLCQQIEGPLRRPVVIHI